MKVRLFGGKLKNGKPYALKVELPVGVDGRKLSIWAWQNEHLIIEALNKGVSKRKPAFLEW